MFCVCEEEKRDTTEAYPCANPNCQQLVHTPCHNINPRIFSHFECPSCVLKYSDPSYQVLKTLNPPTILTSSSSLNFEVTGPDFQLLSDGQNSTVYLTIRCIRYYNDPYSLHYDMWPSTGTIAFNHFKLKLSDFVDTQSRRLSFQRILMKNDVKKGNNVLNIETEIPEGDNYYYGVYLVKRHNVDSLKVMIENGSRMTAEESKKFVKEILGSKKGPKSTTVSLMDENGNLMETPARGRGCKHVTCFSLENFLKSQESQQVKRWNCPICKNRCYHLIIDECFLKIISKYRGKKLQKYNVTFYKNGVFEVSAGITRGNSTTDAIQIEDTEPLDDSSYLGKALNIIKETMKKCMGPDLGLSVLTIPQTKTIQNTCFGLGKGDTVNVVDVLKMILDIFDPLALRRNDSRMEIEENEDETMKEAKQEQIKGFLSGFIYVTQNLFAAIPNLKEILLDIDAHDYKFREKYELELSILYTIKYITESYTTMRISRKYMLDSLRAKHILNSEEEGLLKLHFEWKNYYKGVVHKPSFNFEHLISNQCKIQDYEDFPLVTVCEIEPYRFNWAVKHILCERKGLWRVIWEPTERWYNVEYPKSAKGVLVMPLKDPFAGMLENDVDRVMDEIMYLKECWKYEVKLSNSRGGDTIEVLLPFVDVDVEEFFKNVVLSEKNIKAMRKQVRFQSLKKDSNLNLKKLVNDFQLDDI